MILRNISSGYFLLYIAEIFHKYSRKTDRNNRTTVKRVWFDPCNRIRRGSEFWILTFWIPDLDLWILDSDLLDSGFGLMDSGFGPNGFRI